MHLIAKYCLICSAIFIISKKHKTLGAKGTKKRRKRERKTSERKMFWEVEDFCPGKVETCLAVLYCNSVFSHCLNPQHKSILWWQSTTTYLETTNNFFMFLCNKALRLMLLQYSLVIIYYNYKWHYCPKQSQSQHFGKLCTHVKVIKVIKVL